MRQINVVLYTVMAISLAVYTTIQQIPPSLFFIDLMAPNPGDKFSVTLVILLVFFIFLIPIFLVLFIQRLMRGNTHETIDTVRTGVFVKRQSALQSAIIGVPVFINGQKAGVVDNGKTKFFDVPAGSFTIKAGRGKSASVEITEMVLDKEQLYFTLVLSSSGMTVQTNLEMMDRELI